MNSLTDRIKLIFAGVMAVAATGAVYGAEPDFAHIASRLASSISAGQAESASLIAEKSSLKAEVVPSDPEVEFEYLWPSSAGEQGRWSAGVSQELPDFRRMGATRRVVRAIDSLDIAQRMAVGAEAMYEAEQKLISLVGARRELMMLQEIHENLDSLTAAYTRAWEKGEVSILDLNKIKIEHARASAADDEAQGNVAALTAEIVALSGGEIKQDWLDSLTDYPMYQLPVAGHGCSPDEGIMEPVVRNSPQYRVMEAREKVALEKINLASKERFPKLTLGYVHAYEEGTHFNGLSAGLTLPVFSRGSSLDAVTAEGMAEMLGNEMKLREMVASANADCRRAHMLERQLAMLGPAVENTNNIRLLKMALEGGEITLLEYLQETSYFVDAAREYNAARLEYALTLASLARWSYQEQGLGVTASGGYGDGVKL